jgi:hypothetical protein
VLPGNRVLGFENSYVACIGNRE